MANYPPPDVMAAFIAGWRQAYLSITRSPATPPPLDSPLLDSPLLDSPLLDSPLLDSPLLDSPLLDSPLLDSPLVDSPLLDSPSSTTPSWIAPPSTTPAPAQLVCTPFSALHGTVSATRLAYHQRQPVAQPVAQRDIAIAVDFYIRERPGETRPLPNGLLSARLSPTLFIDDLDRFVRDKLLAGLPGIVNFTPLMTDKFWFSTRMTKGPGRKLTPCWIGAIREDFRGTLMEFLEKIPGSRPRLHIVIVRHEKAVDSGPDPRLVVMPIKTERPPTVVSPPVVEATHRNAGRARKRARSPDNSPRRSQRRRMV